MKLPHFTQHGTRRSGDAFDLFVDESDLLPRLFRAWDDTMPDQSLGADVVIAKWDHGTIGKLVLEHAAVLLAASEEIERVLQETSSSRQTCSDLQEMSRGIRPVLDEMYDASRGVQPMSVAISPPFIEAVKQLASVLKPRLGSSEQHPTKENVRTALGSERARLRSAQFIRKHAPAHPGTERRWYDRVAFLLRIHAAEDRLRGFPWGESSLGDQKAAQRYDRDL